MNCKFKFHLRTAPPRGAAGDWLGLPDWLRLVEALPNLVGAAGPVGSACRWDAFYCFTHPPGSRSKTEFISFAGRRARTAPAPGLLFPDFQVCGSRSKTEFIDFAGRRARTVPAPEPRSDEKRCTEGPGVRASLPTIIFSKGKN